MKLMLLLAMFLRTANTEATWNDPVITPNVTIIKAEHIQELRTAVNVKRLSCGLTKVTWTDDPIVVGETRVLKKHIDELRIKFLEIPEANTAYAKTAGFSDLTIAKGVTPIRAAHITELRAAVGALTCAAPAVPPPPPAVPKCAPASFSMRCGKQGCTNPAWNDFMSALDSIAATGVNIGTVKIDASAWANPPFYGGKECKPFTAGSIRTGNTGDISYEFSMQGTEDMYTNPFMTQKAKCIISYSFTCK